MLKNFATKDGLASRQYQEKKSTNLYRSNYGQDRDRIIESNAFRRLQYKTQVFVNFHGDHYRTRLTHSLEVAQISRWISSGLQLNKDLSEIISLAHDLGHAPFGHAGEDAINAKIKEYDNNFTKFCHNSQAIKIVTNIENRFIQFKGLNLSWDTIEGLAKHNGTFKNREIHPIIENFDKIYNLDLFKQPSLEAQISAYADDLAYNNHDLEDGFKDNLFSLEDIKEVEILNYIIKEIQSEFTNISQNQIIAELKKRSTSLMVIDIIRSSSAKINKLQLKNIEDVRNLEDFAITSSNSMSYHISQISAFLYKKMYRHEKVKTMSSRAKSIISFLFDHYYKNLDLIPNQFYNQDKPMQSVIDYIAGMTDRYAINKFNEITND